MAKKIIRITEDDIKNIIKECVRNYSSASLLTEDRESKNMKKARNVVRQFMPNANAMNVITAIRNDIPNSRINQCEYLPGVTRMYMNDEITDGETISKLNATLKLLGNAHANEYDNDLNGMSCKDLINRFTTAVANDFQADVDTHNNTKFTPNKRYKIYRIKSTQEAWPFNKYTDWCITSNKPGEEYDEEQWIDEDDGEEHFNPDEAPEQTSGYDMYQTYTHGGLGLFYFCIRDDYQTVPKEKGEGCPLDDYGLSMIATSVDEEGKCNTITCRWNHSNGGNDNIMTPMELSKIIGYNYYQVFKPYSKEELYEMGKIPFGDVPELLRQGKDANKIFSNIKQCENGYCIVSLNDMMNIYVPKTNSLLSKEWFDNVKEFGDGLAPVQLNGNANYIKEDGTMLYDKWINGYAEPFKNGMAFIKVYGENKGMYVIDTNGNTINKKGLVFDDFKQVGNFLVFKSYGDTYTIYTKDGEKLFDQVFTQVSEPDKDGYILLTCRGDAITDENDYRFDYYHIQYETKQGILTPEGNLFMNKFFEHMTIHSNNLISIQDDDDKYMIVTKSGHLIGGMKFDEFDYINDRQSVTRVKKDGLYNYLDYNNDKYLLKKWVEKCSSFNIDKFYAKFGEKWYFMQYDGENLRPLTDMYFDSIENVSGWNTFSFPMKVEKQGKFTLIDENGKLMNTWFDNIGKVYNHIVGTIGNKEYIINNDTLEISEYTPQQKRADREYEEELRLERRYEYD